MSHGKAHRGARAGPSMAATDTGANRTGGLGLSQSHKLLNYALLALVEPRFPVQIPERAARAAHHPPRTASWSHTINYTGGSAAEARPQHPGSMRSRAACAPASPETCRCTPLPARCRLSLSLSLSLFPPFPFPSPLSSPLSPLPPSLSLSRSRSRSRSLIDARALCKGNSLRTLRKTQGLSPGRALDAPVMDIVS